MSKFVDSVFSFLGRRSSKDQAVGDPGSVAKRNRGGRKAVLKADSFVFLPGESTSNGTYLWGEVITPRTVGVPVSSYSDDYSVLSGAAERESNYHRRKNVRSVLVDSSGKLVGRRLSGSFVAKAVRTHKTLDEVEDGSLEAFLKECELQAEAGEAEEETKYHTYDRADAREATEDSGEEEDDSNTYDRLVHLPIPRPGAPSVLGKRQGVEENRASQQQIVLDLREGHGGVRRRASSGGSGERTVHAVVTTQQGDSRGAPVDWDGLREMLEETAVRGDDYAEVREPDRQVLGRAISPREVMLEERIGEGQFGDVHKGTLYPGTRDEVSVAIKTCKPDASHEGRVKFLEEAAVMKKFDHPHIIKLFGVVSHERQTCIVMELAPLGQLRRYLLSEGSRISKLLLLQYIHQMSSAMVHLEAKSYVHRDIAARNVLVTTPEVVKLADFGLSRGLQDGNYYVASRGKLPIKWMAPESINFRRFTGLSDVWMFGVCCWEIMMRGVKPFVGIKNDEVISKIELGERLPLPADTPAPLFSLMNRCWSYEPEKRPYFRDIEATVADVLEEERQLESLTSRRAPPTAPPTDYAPEKPPYRPHSSQGFMQVKRSSLLSDEETWQHNRMSGNLDDSPALPPRIATRFREISPSPHPRDHTPSPHTNGSETPPPKPPRRISPEIPPEPVLQLRANPPPIVPYSVTTITHGDSPAPQMTSDLRRSESPCHPVAIAPIPPPSILLRGNEGAPTESTPSGGVYYSIPEDGVRSLREDGQFVSSRGSGHGSITGSESSREGEVGVSGEMEEKGEVGEAVGEEEVLGKVTNVVKAVMELSHRVSLSPPDEYLELVKGVGMAMRELLHTVDGIRRKIPVQSHHEMDMAQKVLSSDFNQLITAMKAAQKNANTFLEEVYQKEMLAAAHVVAKNSKLLFDAVVSCLRNARLR